MGALSPTEPKDSEVPLERILITDELKKRPSREPDYEGETQALRSLARKLGESPQAALQELCDQALKLCRAESSGISIAETEEGREILRWHAVSGRLKPFLNGTMPRDFSPCGHVVRTRSPQLMERMVRHYGYVRELGTHLQEVLLIPFFQGEEAIGTLWIVAHSEDRSFDAEDLRLLTAVAEFTSGVVQSYLKSRQLIEVARQNRETQEKLEAIFCTSPAAMAMWSGPELRAQGFKDVLHAVLESGKPFVGHEMLARIANGPQGELVDRYYDFSYLQMRDSDGEPSGVYVHAIDATDRVLSRKRLEESNAILQRERDLRERFVSALTHDLRTPITAARINAQLLERKAGQPESIKRGVGRIVTSLDRLDRMIQNLLDANRIKAGQGIPVKLTKCRIDEVATHVVSQLTKIHGERFRFKNFSGPVEGEWDCDAIERVLENLAGNALKYGSPSAPVTIGLRKLEREVELSVHNEGDPISPEDQVTLFDQYRRAESADQSHQRGWGIGLTLVEGIAKAHRGSVRVTSQASIGTTFSVCLPLEERNLA